MCCCFATSGAVCARTGGWQGRWCKSGLGALHGHVHTRTHTHTHTLTHTHAHSLTHSHTHSLTHSHTHTLSHTHTHTHSLTHSHTHTHVRTHIGGWFYETGINSTARSSFGERATCVASLRPQRKPQSPNQVRLHSFLPFVWRLRPCVSVCLSGFASSSLEAFMSRGV